MCSYLITSEVKLFSAIAHVKCTKNTASGGVVMGQFQVLVASAETTTSTINICEITESSRDNHDTQIAHS